MENLKEVIGAGNVGVVKLAKEKNNLSAIKLIQREKIDRHVEREIINHHSLRHPNIIEFKEVFLTPTHLAIVMEYASGGDLFDGIYHAGRLNEDEARFLFQQLISGVSYCHSKDICHRDIKSENILLDGSPTMPQLKICDFGYSKSTLRESLTKSLVGTPAYVAPEIISRMPYDGKMADVWSCGVTLYLMLFGQLPFDDPTDPGNFRSIVQRATNVEYSFPRSIGVSAECKDLISRIFVANPAKRITILEIERHPWFVKKLPKDMMEVVNKKAYEVTQIEKPRQSVTEIMRIIQEAKTLAPTS